MGADQEFGRRRACSHDCCVPNTRAQEQEAVARDITEQYVDGEAELVAHVWDEGAELQA